MWTDGWIMSKCTQDLQKVSTKLLSLPDSAKNLNFSSSAKIKICTLSKAPPPVWPHHQHTHKLSKKLTYRFVLGSLQFQSPGQNTHLFACAGFQDTLLETNQNWAQFQKARLTPYKTMYAFSHSPPGQGVMPTNLLPVIDPRMEPSYTHSR